VWSIVAIVSLWSAFWIGHVYGSALGGRMMTISVLSSLATFENIAQYQCANAETAALPVCEEVSRQIKQYDLFVSTAGLATLTPVSHVLLAPLFEIGRRKAVLQVTRCDPDAPLQRRRREAGRDEGCTHLR
jgi:hypothetical protein